MSIMMNDMVQEQEVNVPEQESVIPPVPTETIPVETDTSAPPPPTETPVEDPEPPVVVETPVQNDHANDWEGEVKQTPEPPVPVIKPEKTNVDPSAVTPPVKTEPVIKTPEQTENLKTFQDLMNEMREEQKKDEARYNRRKRTAGIIQGVLGAIEAIARYKSGAAGENVSPKYMDQTQNDILSDWQRKRKERQEEFNAAISNMYRQQEQNRQDQKAARDYELSKANLKMKQDMNTVTIREKEANIAKLIAQGKLTEAKTLIEDLKFKYAGTEEEWKIKNLMAGYEQKISAAEKNRNGGTKEKTEDQLRRDKALADMAEAKAKKAREDAGIEDDALTSTTTSTSTAKPATSTAIGNGKTRTKQERQTKARELGL